MLIAIPTPITPAALPNGLNTILSSFRITGKAATLIFTVAGQTADGKWLRSGDPSHCGVISPVADLTADPQLKDAYAILVSAIQAKAGGTFQSATLNARIVAGGALSLEFAWTVQVDGKPASGKAELAGDSADAALAGAVFPLETAVAAYCAAHGILQGA